MQTEDLKSHYEIRVKNRRRIIALTTLEESLRAPGVKDEDIKTLLKNYNMRVSQLSTPSAESTKWAINSYDLTCDEILAQVEVLLVDACEIHSADADTFIKEAEV
jgi:hypothetical protein